MKKLMLALMLGIFCVNPALAAIVKSKKGNHDRTALPVTLSFGLAYAPLLATNTSGDLANQGNANSYLVTGSNLKYADSVAFALAVMVPVTNDFAFSLWYQRAPTKVSIKDTIYRTDSTLNTASYNANIALNTILVKGIYQWNTPRTDWTFWKDNLDYLTPFAAVGIGVSLHQSTNQVAIEDNGNTTLNIDNNLNAGFAYSLGLGFKFAEPKSRFSLDAGIRYISYGVYSGSDNYYDVENQKKDRLKENIRASLNSVQTYLTFNYLV